MEAYSNKLCSPLTDHMFPHMSHGVKLLLADLAGELLLSVAVHYFVMLV